MKKLLAVFVLGCLWALTYPVLAADVVPTDIMQPGTQPKEVGNLEAPDKCDNCHGGYDPAVEPAFLWRGSAMGNAGRDPIFWATLAIAEQDFDGSGDLCIRCHSTGGWYGGRSTPTDGSGLAASDSDGVDCDTCHKITDTDNSEHLGEMFPPFIANVDDSSTPSTEGYYGSGMLSLSGGNDKLGPYDRDDAQARHQRLRSLHHRDVDFCGSCHDVSNPAVGDLAPNNGAQIPLNEVGGVYNGEPNVIDPNQLPSSKAAFNNAPYMYGVVERTFSEFKAGGLDTLRVSEFTSLPADLQQAGGSLAVAYGAALAAGQGGDYADVGTLPSPVDQGVRYFSCQTCHLRPTTGQGCNKRGTPIRHDLPMHDMTGGNTWIGPLIKYQNDNGLLRLGDGLTQTQRDAIDAGRLRAAEHLRQAASLEVTGDTLKVINLTGHKLISGYPEGRRMWLNIKWYDSDDVLLREDGEYGPLGVTVTNPANGEPVEVESILDLHDPNTVIYEAHYAMTKEWAVKLRSFGYPPDFPLSYDRLTGNPDYTLGQLASQTDGSYHETFHFVLNNHVAKDNRIPPYGMEYDEAARRNALPVPADQFGNPGAGGVYNYWHEVALTPPATAVYATIDLLYQGTSWEYIQFLWKANDGQNGFLAQEGINMLDAWLNAGPSQTPAEPAMVPPTIMASATWGTEPQCSPTEVPETTCDDGLDNDCDGLIDGADGDCQVTTDCTAYQDQVSCVADPACRWNKRKGCLNR